MVLRNKKLKDLEFFRVKIMLPWDPQGKNGPKRPLPDNVSIAEPKDEPAVTNPYSEAKANKLEV